MNQQAVSLIDVLTPPGNRWLKELSRRKSELPAGVRIVRFGAGDDDTADNDEVSTPKARRDRQIAA
jgi:hypothetical protein